MDSIKGSFLYQSPRDSWQQDTKKVRKESIIQDFIIGELKSSKY